MGNGNYIKNNINNNNINGGNKTLGSKSLDELNDEISKNEGFNLKFYFNLGSVIILGILFIICLASLFVPLEIRGTSHSKDGFLLSIFHFDDYTNYSVVNTILILYLWCN